MITKESLEILKNRVDIVDLIGSYLELKRSGATYKARCPFHEERTASFNVNPKGFYYCFGCQAKGDIISFVQEFERLSFEEAAQKIADQYNVTLEYESGAQIKKRDYRPLEALKAFFARELGKNDEAAGYLRSRGLSEALIERFEIGYAPESRAQLDLLRSEKIPFEAAKEAGALVEDENGRLFARFTKRVIFPIYAPNGKVAGFGGRTLGDHAAKYINSPQSEFFNKSRLLYGFHIAREAILKQKSAIVCEGYMDAVMLHQAGFTNAIATLGTALTAEHLPLLKRLDDPKIILSYDCDAAGIEAAFKASKLLAAHNFKGGAAIIEGGKDPAELIARGGAQALARAYENAKPFAKFAAETIVDRAPNADAAFSEAQDFIDTLTRFAAEEAARYAAAKLAIDFRRFKIRAKDAASPTMLSGKRDLGELSLIKTLSLDAELHASVIDYLDSALFSNHRDLYAALINGDINALRPLQSEDRLKALNRDETLAAIRRLMMIFCEKEARLLRADRQTERMIEAQKAIVRLRRGEIIAFRRF
ncbi:MAG: DNA primase [Helicobacteraceae bacterium]|jgi:DNA primase|nr:DNA primase [Helicobacteraceae bacterium]